jgi:hypothetical protein
LNGCAAPGRPTSILPRKLRIEYPGAVSVAGELPITYTWHRNFEHTNFYTATLYSTNCTLVLTNMTPDKACFFNLDINNAAGYAPDSQVITRAALSTNGRAKSDLLSVVRFRAGVLRPMKHKRDERQRHLTTLQGKPLNQKPCAILLSHQPLTRAALSTSGRAKSAFLSVLLSVLGKG